MRTLVRETLVDLSVTLNVDIITQLVVNEVSRGAEVTVFAEGDSEQVAGASTETVGVRHSAICK